MVTVARGLVVYVWVVYVVWRRRRMIESVKSMGQRKERGREGRAAWMWAAEAYLIYPSEDGGPRNLHARPRQDGLARPGYGSCLST
jgi:hypothetical protein